MEVQINAYSSVAAWVGALLYWSCAHLLASKLFMKQILKRRLSARPHLIWLENGIDAHASSPSLSFSLPLSLRFEDSDKNVFLPVSPQLQTQSDMDTRTKTDLKKTLFFFPPPFILLLIYCLCQPSICVLKKGVSWTFSTRAIFWCLGTYQVCFTVLCSATLWPYKHIAHPWSKCMLVIPQDEASYAQWDKCCVHFFCCVIFLLEPKCCRGVPCPCNIKHTSTPRADFIHDALGSHWFIAVICNVYFPPVLSSVFLLLYRMIVCALLGEMFSAARV